MESRNEAFKRPPMAFFCVPFIGGPHGGTIRCAATSAVTPTLCGLPPLFGVNDGRFFNKIEETVMSKKGSCSTPSHWRRPRGANGQFLPASVQGSSRSPQQKKLIPTYVRFIAGESMRVVAARDLHGFLGSNREFATWVKSKVSKWRFIEGADFLTKLSKSPSGRPRREYWLTMDMAKMIAMAENSEMGDKARRYFIECERELIERKAALPAPPAVNLQSAIPTRLLVTVKHGEIESTQDVSDCVVVDAADLKAVQLNAEMLSSQIRTVLGDGPRHVLYKKPVPLE